MYVYIQDYLRSIGEPNYNSIEALSSTKEKILNNYYQKNALHFLTKRMQASFDGMSIKDIDNFFINGQGQNGSKGYVDTLQQLYNKQEKEMIRVVDMVNNSTDFFTQSLSSLQNIPTKLSKNDIENKFKDVKLMLKNLEALQNELSHVAAYAKQYLLAECCQNPISENGEIIFPTGVDKPWLLASLNGTTVNLSSLTGMKGVMARSYSKILYNIQQLQNISLYSIDKNAYTTINTNNFQPYAALLKQFHASYEEAVASINQQAALEMEAELTQQIQNITNIHSGMVGNAHFRNADTSLVSCIVNNSSDLKELDSLQWHGSSKNDTTTTATLTQTANNGKTRSFSVSFGANVKAWSDQTLQNTGGMIIFDTYSNIFKAAQAARAYGLPAKMATEDFIINLGGALYGRTTKPVALNAWKEYRQMLTELLFMDALMGRMIGNQKTDVTYNNNMILIMEGHVYYIPALIRKIVKSLSTERAENIVSKGIRYQPDHVNTWNDGSYIFTEKAHYDNLKSGGSGHQATAIVSDKLYRLGGIKITINSNWLMSLAR